MSVAVWPEIYPTKKSAMYMTGTMRAPTAAEALQLSQQVQTAERRLKEAQECHGSELLRVRQEVHYEWKQFYKSLLKEKEMEKEMEKALKEKDKEMEKEMEKALKEKDKEMEKEMELTEKEKGKVLIYMKEMEKALKEKETDSDRDRKRCRLIILRIS